MFPRFRLALVHALLAGAVLAASASPFTSSLDGLRADLAARQAALAGLTDPISEVRLAFVVAALGNIDSTDSSSFYGDVKTLRKVAIKIERAYGANDTGLLAALLPDIATVGANVQALDVRIASVASPKLAAKLTAASGQAAALVAVATTPPKKKLNTVTARSTALRDAQKIVDASNAKIDHASNPGACGGDGRVTADIDGVAFAPTYAAVQKVLDAQDALLSVQVSGYYYDAGAADPYARGTIDLLWSAATFTGAGTYTLSGTGTPTILSFTGGVVYSATSGTITLTDYDEAGRYAAGTFDCTLTDGSGTVVKVVTNGSFRVCRFVDVH